MPEIPERVDEHMVYAPLYREVDQFNIPNNLNHINHANIPNYPKDGNSLSTFMIIFSLLAPFIIYGGSFLFLMDIIRAHIVLIMWFGFMLLGFFIVETCKIINNMVIPMPA